MNSKLDKNQVERFSRQIVLKDIGASGQKKIIQSKVLIIGMGGLGCPVATGHPKPPIPMIKTFDWIIFF